VLFALNKETADSPFVVLLGYGLAYVILVLVSVQLVKTLFRTTYLRAFIAWLCTLIPQSLLFILFFLVVIPYLIGAYRIPYNNAPTLFGLRQYGTCPDCGGQAVSTYEPELHGEDGSQVGTCFSCQKHGPLKLRLLEVHDGDRIVVNKITKPVRWDVITYRAVHDSAHTVCSRLVGLPGESVEIRDGGVWINGELLTPPAELSKLKWSPPINDGLARLPRNPVTTLGADEYFVLGDFPPISNDSRYWGPLPGKNIDGVVDLVFWPLSRMRVLK
jgi:signal peptidase I